MVNSGFQNAREKKIFMKKICGLLHMQKLKIFFVKVILEMPIVYYITDEEIECEIKRIVAWSTSLYQMEYSLNSLYSASYSRESHCRMHSL